MTNKGLLRIGVFYDGSYFTYAQLHYNTIKENGWIVFEPLHELIEQVMSEKEQGFNSYKVAYAPLPQASRLWQRNAYIINNLN